MKQTRIVIFNDTHGWHSNQLSKAFAPYDVDIVLTDLAQCKIDLDSPSGLCIPGFDSDLPDAVIVRGIAPGYLEQITFRMDVLHTLAELDVPVFNSAHAIEHTVDKARTSLKLKFAGINTPKTWACEDKQNMLAIARRELAKGHQLVIKPLFGCQGKGLQRISELQQLETITPVGETFYLQQYIPPSEHGIWQDWRLFVIGDHVCAAMSRKSTHWITNYAQGAECFPTPVTEEMQHMAIAATRAVHASYAGVDLIRDQQGHFTILEVNSVPAWKGLTLATGINVATHLAEMVMKSLQTKQSTSHVI